MVTSSSLCKGHIFFFYVFTFMQESKFFSLFLFIFSFGKHHEVRKDLGTYIKLDMDSMSYYFDITLEVSMLGGETISPYLSMCLVETFWSCVCGEC